MGAFFTSIQVHRGNAGKEEARHAVVEALRAQLAVQGLIEVAPGEEATRVLLVAAQPGPWVSIYDSAAESQDVSVLEDIGKALSARLGDAVVTLLVHDSDVLDLRLFRGAKREAAFSNWPGYFSGKAKPRDPLRTGRAKRRAAWGGLLAEEGRMDELEAAWSSGSFPEESLERMAPLVGWDARFVIVGLHSIDPELRAACTELRFRPSGEAVRGARPPAWGHEGGADEVSALVGEPLILSMVAHNVGGPMKGISIVVWGDAIDQGMVSVSGVRAMLGSPTHPVHVQAPLVESDGSYVATLHELVLPEGVEGPAAALAMAGGSPEAGLERWLSTRLELECDAVATKSGGAELHLGLVPLQNPEQGQTSWTVRLKVRAKK